MLEPLSPLVSSLSLVKPTYTEQVMAKIRNNSTNYSEDVPSSTDTLPRPRLHKTPRTHWPAMEDINTSLHSLFPSWSRDHWTQSYDQSHDNTGMIVSMLAKYIIIIITTKTNKATQ